MNLKIYAPPATEPISLQEMKEHLRLDSGAFYDNYTASQSLAPGSHAIADNYTTHVGTYINVLGYQAIVVLDVGAVGVNGTASVKIQESDDHVLWTDWPGGAFTQVTASNDNSIQKISYTGSKQYIRPVAKVLVEACEFGIQIVSYASDASEDIKLIGIIKAARIEAEAMSWRALITQTWDAYLDSWPDKNFLTLPFGQLQSVVSVAYTDYAGVVTILTETTDYLIDTVSEPARIVLPYDGAWPDFEPYPVNPIAIRFICGYGASADVPADFRTGILMRAADLYSERGEKIIGAVNVTENRIPDRYFLQNKLWGWS